MDLADLLRTTPESLAELQYDELKKHVIKKLDEVKLCFENDLPEEICKHTFYSPAGDAYGSENNCVNFDYGSGDEYVDILEIAKILINLKDIFSK